MPSKKWDEQKVIQRLRERQADGKDLSETGIKKGDGPLYKACCRYFGRYSRALVAAGIQPLQHCRQKPKDYWTRERVVSELQELARSGRPINDKYVSDNFNGLYCAARKRFGSYEKAVTAAGFKIENVVAQKQWSKGTVLKCILEREAAGLSISSRDVGLDDANLWQAGVRWFGDWYSAVGAAGFPRSSVTKSEKWTKERITKKIKELDLSGEDLSLSYNYAHRSRLLAATTRHFGTWEKAVEEAGIPYDKKRRQHKYYSKEEIVGSIRELADKGYDLSWVSFRGTNLRLAAAARKRFGNWETAIRAAGFDYDQIRRNWYLETFKGTLFEEYVRELFDVLGRRVDHQRRFRFEDESCIPDFYDQDSGLWIDAKLDSWGQGIEPTIEKYLRHTDRLLIVYLKGRRRSWKTDSVELVPVRQFYSGLIAKGATELKGRIELLRRGILRPEQRSKLEEFISTVSPEDKKEIIKSIDELD